jgi:Galactose oxidase, central domain/Kelch motif
MKQNKYFSRFSLALGISLVLLAGVSSAQWTSKGPAPRLGHSAVLDTAKNKMIVFGGYTYGNDAPPAAHFNDVWYLTSAFSTSPNLTWQEATTAGTPPNARAGHTAVLDSVNNRMIIFGGFEGFANPVDNDVWVLENANGVGGTPTWVKLSPSGTPPPARWGHSAVYNPTSNRMIIFGGNNGEIQVSHGAVEFNDVWVLENANGLGGTPTWINSIAQGISFIGARDTLSAAYDVTNNRMIVFGGYNSITGTFYSDTWVLFDADDTPSGLCNGAACMAGPLNTSVAPPPSARFGQTAFFDAKSNTMHIFGGYNGTNILNDDWVLTQANALSGTWSQVSPGGTAPLPRFEHSAVYDSSNHRMIIFGGEITTAGIVTDTVAVLSNANAQ